MRLNDMPTQINTILIDADGVIQYAPQDWSDGFARSLAFDNLDQVAKFTLDVFAAETACLCQIEGFDQALDKVLKAWNRLNFKPSVIETMFAIEPHNHVMKMIEAVRACGIRCYVASNQQSQRANFMSTKFDYATKFNGELYSCDLGAAKPSQQFFELALEAVGAKANQTLFIDDRAENVAGARRVGLHSMVYDGRSGAANLTAQLRNFGIRI